MTEALPAVPSPWEHPHSYGLQLQPVFSYGTNDAKTHVLPLGGGY